MITFNRLFFNSLVCFFSLLNFTGYSQGLPSATPMGKYLNGNLPMTTPPPLGTGDDAPLLLSQISAFSDLNQMIPNQGIIPYAMIEEFWSDGADKNRWVAVPFDGSAGAVNIPIVFADTDPWIFPRGTVIIKHFEVEGQKLETRFEVKGEDDVFYYLTYKWNAQQTDATLLTGSDTQVVNTSNGPQTWYFPSREECVNCHLTEVGSVLGLHTKHINRDLLYPSTGILSNQLITLSHIKLIDEKITNSNVANYIALSAKDDLSATLEDRARSYIDVNCSNCHQPDVQNSAMFDGRYSTPIDEQMIVYGPLVYDEGLIDPLVIVPMEVNRSMLHFRTNSLINGIAMPPLAKNMIDTEGVQLIEDWINSLEPYDDLTPFAQLIADPTSGGAPLTVSFDASSSFDPNGLSLTFDWDFGDGNVGSGETISHVFFNEGAYNVILTVDNGTDSSQDNVTIIANNANPGTNTVDFIDETSLLMGSNFSGVAIGVADMNADGKDDIIRFNQARSLNIQYQNAANSNFTGHSVGDVSGSFQWGMCIADFDQNGYNDVFSGGAYDNLRVVKNMNGSNSFVNQTIPNSNIFLQGVNFVDIDNDGWSDVFACHDDAVSRSYKNDQQGNLIFDPNLISTETVPVSDNSGNYASIWTDYDNDDDLDLYISKCRIGVTNPNDPRRINMLWQNDGSGNFTEVAQTARLKIGAQTWLTDFGDIDNDGDMDALVINHYDDPNLMRNNGNGTFTDITLGSGLLPTLDPDNFFGIQALFRDFNNDGFVDLIVTGEGHHVFYNNGNGTFTVAPNPFNSSDILSPAVGDLNHDGFLDVYASYGRAFNSPGSQVDRLWMNEGNNNNYLIVNLKGTISNINGIGARLELYGGWGKQIREVRSGEGYGIMNSLNQHFGIGPYVEIEKLVVKWPSGTIDEIFNPSINQYLYLTEGVELSDCEDVVTTSNNLTTDESANIGIETNGIVRSGNSIRYQAGQYIALNQNFEVESNATFSAIIDACNN